MQTRILAAYFKLPSVPSSVQRRPITLLVMDEGSYYTYTGLLPSQGPLVLGDGRTDSSLSDIPSYPYFPHVNAEVRSHSLRDALLIVN